MPKLNTFFRAFLIIICFAAMLSPAAAREDIPPAPRELRGLWVATVSNLDWPSSRNLSTEQAKAELVELFDLAQELNMNAVVFQVRPAGDAFYPSPWEPWSAYLTGKQGRAPEPAWDPLQFAIDEAHRRAMELHVWLNPFRASVGNAITSDQHISKRRPDLVHTYGNKLWMDPGEPEAQNYVLNIISDLLKRYDFDALHFDDYFYPYPESGVDFPDDTAWRKYQASGGTLSRDDWRRANVNDFIRRTSELIRSKGDGTRFGVSPFGIWQPGHPPGIRGMNPYNALYADSRLWLQKGWVDYLSPQLYWSIDSGGQSYTDLLAWWTASEQNPMKRHVWPGLALYRIDENKYDAEEILNQVRLARRASNSNGTIHFRAGMLKKNSGGVTDALRRELWRRPALPPASPWIDNTAPSGPRVALQDGRLSWQAGGSDDIRAWVVYAKLADKWWVDIVPASRRSLSLKGGAVPSLIAVSAVDNAGNESPRSIVRPQETAAGGG